MTTRGTTTCCWLPAACYFLLSTRYFLLATCCLLPAACYFLLSTRYLLLATCYLLPATCYFLLATCYLLLTTCYLLLTTDELLLTTCYLLLATYYLLLTSCYLLLTGGYLPFTTCRLLPERNVCILCIRMRNSCCLPLAAYCFLPGIAPRRLPFSEVFHPRPLRRCALNLMRISSLVHSWYRSWRCCAFYARGTTNICRSGNGLAVHHV